MFYIPLRPPAPVRAHAKHAVGGAVAVVLVVSVARVFPGESLHLVEGLKDGFQTLLIEHLLHHWGEIMVAVGAAGAHHFHD